MARQNYHSKQALQAEINGLYVPVIETDVRDANGIVPRPLSSSTGLSFLPVISPMKKCGMIRVNPDEWHAATEFQATKKKQHL